MGRAETQVVAQEHVFALTDLETKVGNKTT